MGAVGIAKLKCFVEAVLDEVNLGAVDQRQRAGIHDDLDAVLLEHDVVGAHFIRVVHHVSKPGTAGFLDTDAQTDTLATIVKIASDALCR